MNGNGRWFHSVWLKGGARLQPTKSGWYAARPECCNMTVKLFLAPNLLDCYVEGEDSEGTYDEAGIFYPMRRNADDYEWWYPLKHQHDRLPEFRE